MDQPLALIQRLAKAPLEMRTAVLREMPTSKLLELCGEKSAKDFKFCDDYDFWKSIVERDGIVLPENFDQFVDISRSNTWSRAAFLREFFYNQPDLRFNFNSQSDNLMKIYINLLDDFKVPLPSVKVMQKKGLELIRNAFDDYLQFILDHEYLASQRINLRRNRKPLLFYTGVNNFPGNAFYLDDFIEAGEFDFQFKGIMKDYGFSYSTFLSLERERPEIYRKLKSFYDQLGEQNLALLPSLLSDGDIIDVPNGIFFYVSYDTKRESFLLTPLLERNEILPTVALPYLCDKRIQNREQLQKQYENVSMYLHVYGVAFDNHPKQPQLARAEDIGKNNVQTRKWENCTFYIYKL